jgi:hypothetical protein
MEQNSTKRKIFIITSKELYWVISENLNQVLDFNDVSPLLPYDFKYYNYIDGIIINNSNKHLIKSHDYVMTLPGVELLDRDEIENLRNEEAMKRGYKDWLKDKFEYSKQQIAEADICLVVKSEQMQLDEPTGKEIKNEIKYATNKNKPIITMNIDRLNYKDKKISLYNDKKAA